MVIDRTRNAARNILFNGLLKLLNIILPFFMRSAMLYFLGVRYLGLSGLFASILSALNLAELGVGAAMVFSMYRPIAEDDAETVCALLRLYRKYYRIIGFTVAAAGVALTPFLHTLIKGDIPAGLNLYVLYYMNLAATVLSYWLFAYKNSLLLAHQRVDVGSKIAMAVNFVRYTIQFLIIALLQDYYLFFAVQILAQVASNLFTALRVSKMYPQYKPRGELDEKYVRGINQRIRDFFTSRLSATIFNSADTLVVSAFLGLTVLAVYQNYFNIIAALRSMIEVVVAACIAGIGNSLVTESEEKNYSDLEKLTLLFSWMLCVCSAMLLCVYQPFMQLWMGAGNMLEMRHVVCFVIYFYAMGVNKLVNMFKDAAGIWHLDRFRPLTAAAVNLALNLATVKYLGLYGVLLSSVVSILIVQIPWLIHNLFHEVFPQRYQNRYIGRLCAAFGLAMVSCLLSWLLCRRFTGVTLWQTFILNSSISFLVPNVMCLLVYGRSPVFRKSLGHIRMVLPRRK